MTNFQIVSLVVLGVVAAVQFLPSLKLPKSKPNTLKQIEAVIAIRDSATNPEVTKACQALLQALLQ